jgi:fibronectin type 3 domain-containing protein
VSTATLQWSASTDSRVQGYRVYYGTGSRTYLQTKGSGANAGASTTFTVSNLTSGRTYYFAVTSFDSAGNESDYSSEATRLIN